MRYSRSKKPVRGRYAIKSLKYYYEQTGINDTGEFIKYLESLYELSVSNYPT